MFTEIIYLPHLEVCKIPNFFFFFFLLTEAQAEASFHSHLLKCTKDFKQKHGLKKVNEVVSMLRHK